MNHVFPDHWSFMLGEVALYCFVILVITGTYLALFFHASSEKVFYHGSYAPLVGQKVSVAFRSMLHISLDVPAGLLIRQMHHWAADIFLWAIVAHLARIFFTAAQSGSGEQVVCKGIPKEAVNQRQHQQRHTD